jgi:hypothetical protein
MQFISLGRHCDIAHNIKKYINNDTPTQFFDWVRTEFKCVLHILNLRYIDTIFNIENLNLDTSMFKIDGELTITLKNFERENLVLLFHHEIQLCDYYSSEVDNKLIEFIDKYKRRFNRSYS